MSCRVKVIFGVHNVDFIAYESKEEIEELFKNTEGGVWFKGSKGSYIEINEVLRKNSIIQVIPE